jgi:hypothetical protein
MNELQGRSRSKGPVAVLLVVLAALLGWFAVDRFTRDQRAIDTDRTVSDQAEAFNAQTSAARSADPSDDLPAVSENAGIAIAVVDAVTKEPISRFRILAGIKSSGGAAERLKGKSDEPEPANWQPDTLTVGENGAGFYSRDECYDETMFRVEADGYEPQTTHWIGRPDRAMVVVLRLVADTGVGGRIFQPDGQPAAGATVAIAMPGKRQVRVEDGQIRDARDPKSTDESDRWRRPTLVRTDAEGRFRLPAETDPRAVALVVHESGTVDMNFADFRQQAEITLRPWGRIEGRVRWQDRAGAGEPIGLSIHRGPPGYPSVVGGTAETHSDSEGKFVFEKLLPGAYQISRLIELPKDDAALADRSQERVASIAAEPEPTPTMFGMSGNQIVQVAAGPEPTPVLIGGQGRTVTGRLTGRDSWENVTFTFAPDPPPKYWNRYQEGPAQMAYRLWRDSPIGPIFFREGLKPDADGSFALADVLPGHYRLIISAPGERDSAGSFPVNVEAERLGEAPAALDLVEIEVKVEQKEDVALPEKFAGSEIIARVGPEEILASDVLPNANEQVDRASQRAERPLWGAELEPARKWYMSKYLDELIEVKLAVVDGRSRLPNGAWEKIVVDVNAAYDKEYLPKVIAEEGCASAEELDAKLRENGSSLDALRRATLENSFAQHWIDEKSKDEREITEEEARNYYDSHQADYSTPARARWKHLTIRFDKYGTNKEEARIYIGRVEQQLKAGFEFGKVAEAVREDVVIDDQADNWINQGSLASEELDTALFTLPIGQLSEILEDERGVHIIRVVERKAEAVTPFAEVESEIREKIQAERNLERRVEYQANLRATIPVWNLFEEPAAKLEIQHGAYLVRGSKSAAEKPAADKTTGEAKKAPDRWVFPDLFPGDPQKPAEVPTPADLLKGR